MEKLRMAVCMSSDATPKERSDILSGVRSALDGFASVEMVCDSPTTTTFIAKGCAPQLPLDEFPTITVSGPTGSGKTIVMDKIAVMLASLGTSFEPGALKCGGETLRLLSHPRDMLKPRVERIEVAVGVNTMGAVSGVAAMAGYILGSDSVPAEIYELARSVVAGACE